MEVKFFDQAKRHAYLDPYCDRRWSIWFRGQPNDIYFQVGLITVVGLAAKNAILIVEFATELRGQGLGIREAAIEAARERLRPILMTTLAAMLGALPLLLGEGPGSERQSSIGGQERASVRTGKMDRSSVGRLGNDVIE